MFVLVENPDPIFVEDVSEALSVKRSINTHGEETRGKNENARRTMRLTNIASKVLTDQRAMLDSLGIDSPWVFPDEHGNRTDPNHMYKMWAKYRNDHNIDCTIHEIRYTFISINKIKMPIELLKGVIGHSVSMDTIAVYGHEVDGEQDLAAQYVDNALKKYLIFELKVGG